MPSDDGDRLVVVLNDGETYTGIEGCRILIIPGTIPDWLEDEHVKNQYAAGKGLSVSEQLVKDRALPTVPHAPHLDGTT